jgi:O-antigen biosynthesis protein WbqV
VQEDDTIGLALEILELDMGKPVRILELAEQMIRLAGLRPYQDIPIVFIGLRPGEKLHEELDPEISQVASLRHPKILRGRLTVRPGPEIREAVTRLTALAEREEADGIRTILAELLPDARLRLAADEAANA